MVGYYEYPSDIQEYEDIYWYSNGEYDTPDEYNDDMTREIDPECL